MPAEARQDRPAVRLAVHRRPTIAPVPGSAAQAALPSEEDEEAAAGVGELVEPLVEVAGVVAEEDFESERLSVR